MYAKYPLKTEQGGDSAFSKCMILIISCQRKSVCSLHGMNLKTELKEVDSLSGIFNVSVDFLTAEARSKHQTYVPRVEDKN